LAARRHRARLGGSSGVNISAARAAQSAAALNKASADQRYQRSGGSIGVIAA